MSEPAASAAPIGPGSRLERRIATPEGVVLPVELGQRGERATAFIIDILILFGTLVGIYVLLILALIGTRAAGGEWLLAAVILLSFFVRSFYFAFFELRWQGRTPGKRLIGLRVIDRSGGPLKPEAVLARNLLREVEVFLPFSLMMSATFAQSGWGLLLTIVWLGVFLFMPLFNRDGLRVGDMVAGTWVVTAPKAALLDDLAGAAAGAEAAPAGEAVAGPHHVFTAAQLDAYGIYELQTLENVLRDTGPNADRLRAEVTRRIVTKIGWSAPEGEPLDDKQFLGDFYAALRGRLERRMLFGRRRKDKHDTA